MIVFKTFAKSSLIHDQNFYYTRSDDLMHINLPPLACETRSLQNETISKRNQTNSPNCLHVVRAQFVPSWGNSMFLVDFPDNDERVLHVSATNIG